MCLCFNTDFETSRFCSIPKLENFLNHKAKIIIDISKQRSTVFRRTGGVFPWKVQNNFRLPGIKYFKNTFQLPLCQQKLFGVCLLVVAIRVNCATISAMLRSSTLAKCYNSPEERIISFECTKANHDKLPHENNSVKTTRQITLHIIYINFQAVFFENNFREFATLNGVCEEIIKLHIFIESRQEYF